MAKARQVAVFPDGFSPSGDSLVYWAEPGVAMVASLADCKLKAKVAASPERIDSSHTA